MEKTDVTRTEAAVRHSLAEIFARMKAASPAGEPVIVARPASKGFLGGAYRQAPKLAAE